MRKKIIYSALLLAVVAAFAFPAFGYDPDFHALFKKNGDTVEVRGGRAFSIGGLNALTTVPAAHDFANATARDAYFDGTPNAAVGDICHLQDTGFIQECTVAGSPGTWVNVTALTKGPQGDAGTNGSDGADGTDGEDGEDGVDAYVYVAYSSDNSGTDFNLTPSDSLKYRAEIHSDTEIASPDSDDFSGATWVKYLGDDGEDGSGGGSDITALVEDESIIFIMANGTDSPIGTDGYECDGTADNVQIQAAIDALTTSGGKVVLSEGVFNIAATITLKSGVTIEGVRPQLTFTDGVAPDLNFEITGGTILQAVTYTYPCFSANTDDSPETDVGVSCAVRDLGIKAFQKAISAGALNHYGLAMSHLSNIFVDGKDSGGTTRTELAFEFINPQHIRGDHLYCYSVEKAMLIQSYHDTSEPGNSVFTDFYAYLKYGVQPTYGIQIEAKDTGGASPKSINYITMLRPQVNCFGLTAPDPVDSEGNALIKLVGFEDGGSGSNVDAYPNSCSLYDSDAEGDTDYSIHLINTRKCRVNMAGSGGTPNVHLKMENAKYSVISSTIPDAVVAADANTSPSSIGGLISSFSDRAVQGMVYYASTPEFRLYGDNVASKYLSFPIGTSTIKPVTLSLSKQVYARTGTATLGKDRGGFIPVANTAAITLTLPTAVGFSGLEYTFKKTTSDAYAITLDGNSSETIDGAATNAEMDAQYDTMTIVSDGSNWLITNKIIAP
jgi:hypothetical protein